MHPTGELQHTFKKEALRELKGEQRNPCMAALIAGLLLCCF